MILLAIGTLVTLVTVFIHGLGTTYVIHYLGQLHAKGIEHQKLHRSMMILGRVSLFLLGLHILEVGLWAVTYLMLPQVSELQTWEQAIYFSVVTFTTLGSGDHVLHVPRS